MDESKVDIFNQDAVAKELSAEEKKKRQRDINDLRKILAIPEGRRFIWKQLSEAGIFHTTFSQNAMQTSFLEGQRQQGLRLLNDVNEADTYAFAKMQGEFISEHKSKKEVKEAQLKKEE